MSKLAPSILDKLKKRISIVSEEIEIVKKEIILKRLAPRVLNSDSPLFISSLRIKVFSNKISFKRGDKMLKRSKQASEFRQRNC